MENDGDVQADIRRELELDLANDAAPGANDDGEEEEGEQPPAPDQILPHY